VRVARELDLHRVPYGAIDDGRVLTGIAQFAMSDLADIDRVGEQLVDLPARERRAAVGAVSVRGCACRCSDALASQTCFNLPDRAKREIEREDGSDGGGVIGDDLERPSTCPWPWTRRSCRGCARR